MNTIGFRVKPDAVIFAIYDSDGNRIINIESLKLPAALSVPERLKYVRSNMLDIIREYDVKRAAIRITESVARKVNVERVQIEGVIQEAFASSPLEKYCVAQIATLSPLLEIPRAEFKKYVEGEVDFGIVENWGGLKKEEREAVLAAVGAANV